MFSKWIWIKLYHGLSLCCRALPEYKMHYIISKDEQQSRRHAPLLFCNKLWSKNREQKVQNILKNIFLNYKNYEKQD
jgi:hypothetical protein